MWFHLSGESQVSVRVPLSQVGFSQLIVAFILFVFFPFHENPGPYNILVAVGSGILNILASVLILNALRQSEVSRVIPVISSGPIFVALLSVPLLGEMLGYWQWLAILMTVIGAVLISLQTDGTKHKAKLQKSFFILGMVALMCAIAAIGFKYALETMSFWNMYGINGVCIGTLVLTYAVLKGHLSELKNLRQRTQKFLFVAGDQCIGIISGILAFNAMGIDPVSLVNAILNIRPAFVFIFTLVLCRFFPSIINDRLNRKTALLKVIAIALMTAGIVIISLAS